MYKCPVIIALAIFFGGMFALVSRDAHPLNPALSVEARREVYLCLLSVWKPRLTACDKAYFCHDKFGASETWRDVFISRNRIGKTRAKKKGKRRTREEGETDKGRDDERGGEKVIQKCLRWKEGRKLLERQRARELRSSRSRCLFYAANERRV